MDCRICYEKASPQLILDCCGQTCMCAKCKSRLLGKHRLHSHKACFQCPFCRQKVEEKSKIEILHRDQIQDLKGMDVTCLVSSDVYIVVRLKSISIVQ
jgi:hypothetical protein